MIETERLRLRRWEARDVAPYQAMARDAEVMRHLLPMTDADCAATVGRMNAIADATGSCFWAVERRDDGRFIGFCGIKPGPEGTPIAGEPEIGWRLAHDAWGQGYAREAAEACLDHAWRETAARRVVAITATDNRASWGLMIRLGMARVEGGDFDHPAVPVGHPLRRHILYALDRPAA